MPSPALHLRGVSKHFGGVAALSDVELSVNAGEVHGLLGQNGSGKSTLVKVLAGYHAPDEGSLSLYGKHVDLPIQNPRELGIAIIHQDLALVDSMSVLENIGISDGYGRAAWGKVSWRAFRKEVAALLHRLDSTVSPDAPVGHLRGSDRSIVAIARAVRLLEMTSENHVFILDEPTAYLGAAESDRLMAVMRRVSDQGSSVVFVSHKLGEVQAVTDRCTVLRDGGVVATVDTSRTTTADLVNLQLGRELGDFYPPLAAAPRESIVLSVDNLDVDSVNGFDLLLRQGEVLGITGLAGMGQDEVIQALSGARGRHGGTLSRGESHRVGRGVHAALAASIALVPSDRKGEGLWLEASARENYTLPMAARGFPLRRLDQKTEATETLAALTLVGAKPLAAEVPVGNMSGGNQQKVLMAKWMSVAPDVLLLHEPTQGVDAAARREILGLVNDAAERGTGIVVCSTDYEQLSHLCHRVLVLRHGEITAELAQPFTEGDLMLACQGGTASEQDGEN